MKKKTYILTFLMMLCSFVFGQGCPWTQPSHFENTMTVSGRVLIQGEWVLNDDASSYTLGAFCGNELRGVIPVSEFNTGTQITIGGENGQSIIFKLWDGNALSVLEYSGEPITFVTNNIITMFDINFTSKNHWNPSHNTNSNMTITARVTINDANVNGDYEIGAFIGDEVCGSARVNNSIAYIVISHNEEDGDAKVTFKLWNHGANPAGLTEEITDVTVNYEHNATYGSQESPFVINFNKAVAEVAGVKFATLAAAVNATTATNTEVKVLRDFALDNTVTIANNQTVVLNLDGKTISQEKACTASYEMINNKGNLTITGNGKLSFKDTGAGDPTFGWGSYTVRNEGNLVVENGTIVHLGEQDAHCIMAIFQYSGSTTINGGTISTPYYRSARLWKGNMTINGGTFDGQVWVQAVDNTANLTINGGTFEPNGGDASAVFVTNNQYKVELDVTAGTFNGKIGTSDANKEGVKGSISGGTFTATAKEDTNVALLQDGYVFKQNVNGTYGVVPGLNGSGTEDDPFIIMDMVDLTFFRDYVNSGGTIYNAPGVYVALGADIDMAGVNWVGIGSATADHGFMGNFDGKTYKIQNLTITNPALDSDGYAYAGLFAVTEGTDKDHQNTIKNLTIENVTITTTGHIVSAAIAYPYYTIVDNVKVCGNIAITGGDYTSGVLAYTRRCVNASNLSIVGNEGSFVEGNQVVGGVISDIQMNGGLIADYDNFSAQGIAVKGTQNVGGISGIIATQTLDGASVKNVTLSGNAGVGVVSGVLGGPSTISNVVFENVTGATAVVGATYDNHKAVEARIGDTYYGTFAAALAAANENDIITLLVPYTVEAGETLTIDKKVTYSSNVLGEAMITNKGTLTITGSVDYTYTGAADATYSKGNYTINNSGTLTVNGNVENKTAKMSHASYAINTNAGATLNVENGKVLNLNGHAIRMVSFGTAANNVNINGGYIEGTRALQVQLPGGENAAAPEMKVNINGGELKSNEETYNLAVYVYSNGQSAENFELAISGGTFNGNVAINAKASETMQNNAVVVTDGVFNGQYGVFSYSEATDAVNKIAIKGGDFATNYSEKYAEDNGYIFVLNAQDRYTVTQGQYVAAIGETRYSSVAKAITAANAGETITLLKNVTEDVTIEKDLTIDGANNNYTGNISVNGSAVDVIVKNVNFINGTGYAITTNTIKSITVEGCTVENYGYGFLYSNKSTPTVVVKNVTVNGGNYGMHWVYGSNATLENVTMTNVTYGLYIQNYASKTINVKNSTISSIAIWERTGYSAVQTFNFEGTNTVGSLENSQYAKYVLTAEGTTLTAPEGSTVTTTVADHSVKYLDGAYRLVLKVVELVKTNGEKEIFGSIQEAINAAQDGDEIVLLKNIELSDEDIVPTPTVAPMKTMVYVKDKDITLNMNENSISVKYVGDPYLISVICVEDAAGLKVIGNGSIDVEGVAYGDKFNVAYVFCKRGSTGHLTIENGTYHAADLEDSMVYTNGNAIVNINGGTFKLENVGTQTNGFPCIFNVAGGNAGHVVVNGGTFNADVNHQFWANEVYVPETLALQNNGDDTWTVVPAEAYVKEIATSTGSRIRNVGYATLEEAFAVAMEKDRKDVVLVNDVVLENTLTVNAGEQIVLDLNGKVVSGTCNAGQSHMIMVQNTADLTIKDSSDASTGKLTYAQGTSNTGWAIDLEGNLTLKSGTIELTGDSWSIGYAVDVRPNSWGSEYTEGTTFTMNGGKLVSSDGAVRVASSSADTHRNVSASFVMNGGEIDAAGDGVFVQQSNETYDVLSFTMYGGTIKSDLNPVRVYGPAATDYVNGQNCMNINFFGGNMSYTGIETREWIIENVLRVGGGSSIETILESGNITAIEAFAQVNKLPEGYAWAANSDGTFSAISAVAKIGNNYYSTLQGAVNAAQNGDEITVIKDFTVTTTVVVDETVSIDLNGKTITGSEVMPVIRIQGDASVTVENGNITNNDGYIFILGASDSSTYGNLTIEGGKYHGATSVASVTYGTLTILDGEFSVEPYQGSYAYLINCIDANYNQTAKVAIQGGYFHNWNPENNAAEGEGTNFCALGYEAVTFDGENYFVFEKDTTVQSTSLTAGWTWTSFFVDATFDALKAELGTNGRQIKTQASGFTTYNVNTDTWNGSLRKISADLMYMIKVENAQVINLEAYPVNPSDYEYELYPNWTWISFPSENSISVTDALADVNPVVGDRIKGQDGYAQYTSAGKWQGTLKTLEPGKGYMYQNSTSEIKTLVYPETNGNRGEAPANITAANNLMVPNMSKYANNMNITAVVNIDGEELMTEDFEVAVFAGEELRGSARPIYIESLNRYMLFITVYGEESEELTFKYYDLNSGEELNLFADSKVVFEINSVIGSVEQPSVLSYGTLSIDETSASSFNIYPNPTTRDRAINLQATCDNVEVFNALGVKVAEYQNVDTIDALETAGVYVIRVTINGEVKNCRLVVK